MKSREEILEKHFGHIDKYSNEEIEKNIDILMAMQEYADQQKPVPSKMTSERIKEIQSETAYPESVSVQQALLKVWNEYGQQKPVMSDEEMLKDIEYAIRENLSVSDDQFSEIIGIENLVSELLQISQIQPKQTDWDELKEENRRLKFIIENGLGEKDLDNDCT